MMSLSHRWAGATARAVGSSTSLVQKLALAIGPVRSVIRVIDDHTPPMVVDWAQVGKDDKGRSLSRSYTDFSNARVAINPLPIERIKDAGRAIDVVSGFAMHEASHGKHSRDRFRELVTSEKYEVGGEERTRDVPNFRPMRVAAYLWNLVEDVRIEYETSRQWPGSAPYFDTMLDYMWEELLTEHGLPKEYGESVADKIKVVFLAIRYPDEFARYLSQHLDQKMTEEADWWQAWQADYLEDRTDTKETIERGLAHLGEDPATEQEMEQMTADEKAEEERGEKIRAQLERLMREGIEGAYGVCIAEDGEVRPLSEEEAEAVHKLVRENLVEHTPILTGDGARCAQVRVSKPEESADSRRAYIGRPNALVEAMRSALVFRPSAPEYDIKLQKSGHLDDEELYRFAEGDFRLFSERVIESKPEVMFGLLVDLSGSMYGRKLQIAQRLAQVFVWATQDAEGVETWVWGHTGDDEVEGADIFRLYEPGDPLMRLGLIDTLPHANNYDGFAIAECVNQMRDREQPQKTLIVLSDGIPSGSGYGHVAGKRHVRVVCDWARTQGVNVLQIAVDPNDLRPEDQEMMFGPGNWIGYKSDADLPRQLTRTMAKWT